MTAVADGRRAAQPRGRHNDNLFSTEVPMSTDTELLPAIPEPASLQRHALAPDLASLVERVLTDPSADVTKLEKLLDMNDRVMNRAAKAAFDEAFSRMWPELPEIDERGVIKNKDGSVKSRYSKYEDIQAAVRPVLARFGFSMRHRTEFPADKPNIIRIVGILSGHGHTEESAFEAPPDKNDYRTAIQDQGSTVSYGKRYTTCDLLNIITRGIDNDGQRRDADGPEGYDNWWTDMQVVAEEGAAALEAAWKASKKDFKAFTLNQRKGPWADLKAKAQKADAQKGGAK